jgi:RNA polymerase sigma-54 factor
MVPMTQSQLASFLRVHESTVSRAVAEKYIQLPSGRVVPLSFFFDRALSHRKLIANVLAAEDPSAPYSDQEISDILRRQGICIARRTVMKYREEMNILSSRRRARARS